MSSLQRRLTRSFPLSIRFTQGVHKKQRPRLSSASVQGVMPPKRKRAIAIEMQDVDLATLQADGLPPPNFVLEIASQPAGVTRRKRKVENGAGVDGTATR